MSHRTQVRSVGSVIRRICVIYRDKLTDQQINVFYVLSISQELEYVFKDPVPTINSFTCCSESQNTIRVNLLGTHSTVQLYLSPLLSYLHTQPIAGSHRVYSTRFRHIKYYIVTIGMTTKSVPVKSYNSIGMVKCYYGPL